MSKLLVVEDDDGIAEPLVRALRRDGHETMRVGTAGEALDAAAREPFDLVLLDLGLPDLDGIAVCRELRACDPDLAILVLTARADELDMIVGLDAGADDYVTKPFRLGELLARVRARTRRQVETLLRADDLTVDVAKRQASVGPFEVELTAKEFDLLAFLVRRGGTVVTREAIMSAVWDEHWFGSTRTLDVHVSVVRKKLAEAGLSDRISTVRGVGFRFESPTPGEHRHRD